MRGWRLKLSLNSTGPRWIGAVLVLNNSETFCPADLTAFPHTPSCISRVTAPWNSCDVRLPSHQICPIGEEQKRIGRQHRWSEKQQNNEQDSAFNYDNFMANIYYRQTSNSSLSQNPPTALPHSYRLVSPLPSVVSSRMVPRPRSECCSCAERPCLT